MILLRTHCGLLTKQYLLRCHLDNCPGRRHLDRPLPSLAQCMDEVSHLVPQNRCGHRSGLQTWDQNASHRLHPDSLETLSPSKVLHEAPPEIDESEKGLRRVLRCRLAQLRSLYCDALNSYLKRLNDNILDLCPKCNNVRDTNRRTHVRLRGGSDASNTTRPLGESEESGNELSRCLAGIS